LEQIGIQQKTIGVTRAYASVDKAAALGKALMFAIGNAPTALIRIYELLNENKLDAKLVIAAPVGFVNVVEAKELFLEADIPCIIPEVERAAARSPPPS
jgi:precorrin-8X/cobalt-precorrin-8 methylmutase